MSCQTTKHEVKRCASMAASVWTGCAMLVLSTPLDGRRHCTVQGWHVFGIDHDHNLLDSFHALLSFNNARLCHSVLMPQFRQV
ncbi:hypothetical protein ARMGADRAFT_175953 [Armillaria gallica]|uniref:Uncharacterized protein n=1 Tax=Armillaria gallica TaxID=47427 RepID=A0A2H3C813_ARMGA|nr:hypothetical protein ARMGADRAFT_175953 [Armillaria gallica]